MQKRIKQAQKYLRWGKPNQAIAELKPALKNKKVQKEFEWVPNHLMGIALSLQGKNDDARSYLEKAVRCGSDSPETYHMLSVNYYKLAQFDKAEKYGKKAVEQKTDFLKAWLNLGSVYRSQAKLNEALRCYKKANEIDPANAGVALRIGKIYRDQGDLDQAMKLFDITLKIEEDHIGAMLEKADVYKKKGELDKAIENLDRAEELHGDHVSIGVSKAELYKSRGNYDEAIALYERLLDKYPHNSILRVNYALCLQEVSRFDQSEKNYLHAIHNMDDPREAISNYLMGLHYNPQNGRDCIYKKHTEFGEAFIPKEGKAEITVANIDTDKKLKVGFISGGFRRHPVGWMIAGALEQLPEGEFEISCYTTNNKFDFITRRIHRNIDHWKSIVGYSDDVIKNIILDDNLDILVDLTGHASDNCMNVMACKPAPVLVKWVGGLFNTTGIKAFDFLITDEYESPEGEESYYTEKLVRMPDDYITYAPPAYAPDVELLPANENEYITFGCFNNPTKVNDVVLREWAKIMRQVSGSKLYLKSKQYDTASFREQILEVMGEESISKERIVFEGQSSHDEHLDAYNKVDIALDPWPYSGGLTTCEALYMGVPVITMPGPTFAGRHSTTHLINAGLEQWVTDSWEEYIQIAVTLANDLDALEEWRFSLRKQLLNSPVCDGKRFGAHLSAAFREMWSQRVEGYKNDKKEWQDHITVVPLSDEKINELTDGPATTPLITIKDKKPNENIDITGDESNENKNEGESMIDTDKLVQDISDNRNSMSKINGNAEIESEQVNYSNDDYLIETKDNITICVPADLDVLTTYVLLEQEEWFEPELDFLRQYVKPDMQLVDAGACFGGYSLPLAKKVGKNGKVVAFEPSAESRDYLEKSKIHNGIRQLEIVGRGLSSEAGTLPFKEGETPELNKVDKEGDQAIDVTTLDAWWSYAGQPAIDVVKIDINGLEADVLKGGTELLADTKPLVVASIGEDENDLNKLQEQFSEQDYKLYEYIPGPDVLADHDPKMGVDPYLMNIVGVHEQRIEEFKNNGWIFEEGIDVEAAGSTEWKKVLENHPWADTQINDWEQNIADGNHDEYLQALNLACVAAQIEVSDEGLQSRSRKGSMMLASAQKLIELFNTGNAGIATALTYVRVMSQLGKTIQAVEMTKQLMETINAGDDVSVKLPFIPPLPEHDKTEIKTEFANWLTVRVVEAWVSLKTPTTYMAGEQEQKMLRVLEDNPELSREINKCVELKKDGDEFYAKNTKRNKWFWDEEKDNRPHVSSSDENLGDSGSLKHLYLGYPGKKGGAHGIHEIRAKKVAREIEKKGINTTIICTSSPEFLEALSMVKNNAGYACYPGVMGYDLKVQADMGVTGNIFDLLEIPTFAFLGDHPYTDFMWSRIVNSSDDAVFLTSIPSLKNEMEQIFPGSSVSLLDNFFPLSNQPENLRSLEKRSIDVLIPWGLHKFFANPKSLEQKLSELEPEQKTLGLALHNEAAHNYEKSVLSIFAELYEARFGSRYRFGKKKTKKDFRWLKMLSLVDWTIRKDRRITMLKEQVSTLPENYRVVITAHKKISELIPELNGKNIEWIGEVSKEKLNQLYGDAKIVLNCNPTFLDSVHARVYEGLNNGSFVVSDCNQAIKEIFWEEDAIGMVSDKSNGKSLVDYLTQDGSTLQDKAERGRQIVQQAFTAEKHAKSIIEVITKKID